MIPASSPRRGIRTRRQANSGFTILEVAMAAFVMIFGIASSIIAMQAGYKQMDLARGTTLASQIIQSEMERLRMMNWTMIDALPASATFDASTYFTSNPIVAGRFRITRTATADATRPTEVKDLRVSVTWNGFDGRSHTRSFNAKYAKNGLYDYYYTIAHP